MIKSNFKMYYFFGTSHEEYQRLLSGNVTDKIIEVRRATDTNNPHEESIRDARLRAALSNSQSNCLYVIGAILDTCIPIQKKSNNMSIWLVNEDVFAQSLGINGERHYVEDTYRYYPEKRWMYLYNYRSSISDDNIKDMCDAYFKQHPDRPTYDFPDELGTISIDTIKSVFYESNYKIDEEGKHYYEEI